MSQWPEFVKFVEDLDNSTGWMKMTGCLPRQTACGQLEGVPVWDGERSDCPLVPRDEWVTQPSQKDYEWSDNDQDRYPACTLASLANQAEFYLARTGRAKTNLDWLEAWRHLSGGRGGVALDTALRYVMTDGFPLSDGSGVLIAKEVWDIPNIDAAFSAIMRSGNGLWFGASGHAEWASRVVMGSSPFAEIRGTWGRDYGESGYYKRSLSYIKAGLPLYGAFAIRTWKLRPIDLP